MDRLSSLPEDVLGHILSFLGTKFAVRTSILSRRWMFLYTFATSLDFYCHTRIPTPSFINSTSRVLMHQKGNIKKFTLLMSHYDGRKGYSHVTSLIAAAISRGVEKLNLLFNVHVVDDWALPSCLFFSQTLVTFDLTVRSTFPVIPSFVWLPSLKILRVSDIQFSDSSSLTRFFNGCPLLQDLSLDLCIWEDEQVYTIPALMLRSLRIITDSDPTGSKVEFDVPRLEHFKFCGDVSELYCIHSSSALATADISVNQGSQSDLVISLIRNLSNVTRVALSIFGKVELDEGSSSCPELPTFGNLSSLVVSLMQPELPWHTRRLLHHLLTNSPNMETLVFREGFKYWHSVVSEFIRSPTFIWTLHQLKVIRVHGYSGRAKEIEMVTWFLRKAVGLKQLNVHAHVATDEDF
ncbi:hypothetical protein Dimus_032226 [Dionaea muscipula]